METSMALSITASVLRIVTISVETAKKLNDIRCAWNRAPVTVSSLCSQLKLTAASLSQIQSLLLSNTDILNDKPDLMETFDTTLTASVVLSSWLEKYVQKITKGLLENSKATWKMKFKTLWNEDEVKELSQQLQTQQGAITTLVGLLQMDSISEIRSCIQRQEALLRQIATNTQFLRKTHSIDAPESILETDGAGGSIFSKLNDNGPSQEIGYESVVLNTKVYTKAFTGVLGSSKDDESDNTRTIIEGDTFGNEASKNTSISILMKVSDSMALAVKRLNIDDVNAATYSFLASGDPMMLTIHKEKYMKDVVKLSTSRLRGQILAPVDKVGSFKSFDREKLIIGFPLLQTFQVHYSCHYSFLLSRGMKFLSIQKGEGGEIHKINHAPFWTALPTNRIPGTAKRRKLVWVDMIEIDDSLRIAIDHLLTHFSYRDSRINMDSLDGFAEQIRKLLRVTKKKNIVNTFGRISAHCSSVAELQVFAREWRNWCEEHMTQKVWNVKFSVS